MTESAKALLRKLLATRPKPSEKALKEFFVAIKGQSIAELLDACRDLAAAPAASPLEASVKQRLRKVGGKASDFIPYIWDEISTRAGTGPRMSAPKKMTLTAAIEAAESQLGKEKAEDAVESALKRYISENDTSYQLKGARR